MKRKYLGLFFTMFALTALGQTVDTLTPEKKVRYQINNIKESSTREISTGNFQNTLKSIANLAVTRVPYLTINELRKGKADTASVVFVNQGGRSGNFRFDPSDKTTPDDSVMVIRLGNKRYKRVYDGNINVKWFGASGDGITDDQPAIQKAIDYLNPSSVAVYKFDNSPNAGGTIYFPAGRYRITKTIVLTNSVTLLGNAGPSFYSKSFAPSPSSSVIMGDFTTNDFMIQTQSWRTADIGLKPVKAGRVGYNEPTHWRQPDGKKISVTSGAAVRNLILMQSGKKGYGGIRFCSTTYGNIENCEIIGSLVGIVMDCALFNRIENCHIYAKIAGIIVGESAISNSINHVYLNGDNSSSFAGENLAVPEYYNINRNGVMKPELKYNSATQRTAIFTHGCNILQISNVAFEGWDIGIVNKLGKVEANSLYFEGIYDTAIVCSKGNTKVSMAEFIGVKTTYGIDDYATLTVDMSNTQLSLPNPSVFKGYDKFNPGNNKIKLPEDFITQTDMRLMGYLEKDDAANTMQNNSIANVGNIKGVPTRGNIFTYGGWTNGSNQSQMLISTDPKLPGMWIRSREFGAVYESWNKMLTADGGQLTGSLGIPSAKGGGYNAIGPGKSVGASYNGTNVVMQLNKGLGFSNANGNITSFLDAEIGKFDAKDGFYVNGIKLQAAASTNTADAVGKSYSQSEVQAILTELRDLKQKMKAAGLLAN